MRLFSFKYVPFGLLFLISVLFTPFVKSQNRVKSISDTTYIHELSPVVITATKSTKELSQVSVPMTILSAEDLERRGRIRLADVLTDLPNLSIRYNFGAGIQLQGLDAAYTLILLDGEPLIGRTAGTLDLNRLALDNIEQIEVLRGASSALYGSEALAGVINIITKKPQDHLRTEIQTQYETHHTLTTSFQAESVQKVAHRPLGIRVSANRYSSKGYSLTSTNTSGDTTIDPTVPPFEDYTLSSKLTYKPSPKSNLEFSGRWGTQTQTSITNLVQTDRFVLHDQSANRTDWNIGTNWTQQFSPNNKLTLKAYRSRYTTNLTLTPKSGDEPAENTRFDQFYTKAEAQYDWIWHKQHLALLGGGFVKEQVAADRISGGERTTQNAFLFAENDFVGKKFDVTSSLRLDVHNVYGVHLSPKISALYRQSNTFRLRASLGSGFKAPTFQQLYMDFNNPVVGYSVFGTTGIADGLAQLIAQGQIQDVLMDPSAFKTIKPETAIAFNIGLEWKPNAAFITKLNLFRNNVQNLIETAPVATKTSGQQVFSYFNLNQIYTQGIESEATWQPAAHTSVAASYTFLDSADQHILQQIRAKEIYTTLTDGRARVMRRSEYGGLMNRSRHSATIKLSQDVKLGDWLLSDAYDFNATVRGSYTGRYGFSDINGNLALDIPSEYVKGYMLWHANVTKSLGKSTHLQLGIENIFGHTNPRFLPALSGRIWYIGLRWSATKS